MDKNYINKVGSGLAISERLEIRLAVIVNEEIYFSFMQFKREHPNDEYHFGYVVYDYIDDYTPGRYQCWYLTPESALEDFKVLR